MFNGSASTSQGQEGHKPRFGDQGKKNISEQGTSDPLICFTQPCNLQNKVKK